MTFAAFVDESLAAIRALPPGGDVLGQVFRSHALRRTGTWVEFGVAGGTSLRRMAAERGAARLWGFDTFTGLPERWTRKDSLDFPAGAFAQGHVPVTEGAHLVTGLFQDTLPAWCPPEPVTFAHVDCDIYSAAACVLRHLPPRLAPGAVVLFDELVNYPGFEDHEMRALYEAHGRGLRWEWLAAYGGPEQWPNEPVAIRIVP